MSSRERIPIRDMFDSENEANQGYIEQAPGYTDECVNLVSQQ